MSTNDLTDSDLIRIEKRCESATPGPWNAIIEGRDQTSGSSYIQTAGDDIYLTGASEADHDLIASARQDLPLLVRAVRGLDELADSELARIEQLCEAATPGPWTASIEGRDHTSGDTFIQTTGADLYLQPGASAPDLDFIASARQDVPRLLRALRELRIAT